ncbi:uDENN domain protein [Cooperia oncophora]
MLSRSTNKSVGNGHCHTSITYPELLRRYPTDDHNDFPLPTDVTVFCQPEGCLTLDIHSRCGQSRDPQFFVFMLTEKDSAKKRYAVCLNFYQRMEKRTANTCRHSEKTIPSGKMQVFSSGTNCGTSTKCFFFLFYFVM